jgi:protein-disulfide isomerase
MFTVAAVFVGLLVLGRIAIQPGDASAPPSVDVSNDAAVLAADLTAFYTPVQGTLTLDGTEPKKGSDSPTYTIVEFADYACPHCAEAGELVDRWLKGQSDVQVMFKVYPLTKECNPSIPPEAESNFPPRCIPALYAECAMRQGLFWDVNHDIFANQRSLAGTSFNPDDMDILVRNRGVDVGQLRMCLDESETRRGVGMDAMAGDRAGVRGTPAFFVRGVTDDDTFVQIKGSPEAMFTLIETHRRQAAIRADQAADGAAGEPGSDAVNGG